MKHHNLLWKVGGIFSGELRAQLGKLFFLLFSLLLPARCHVVRNNSLWGLGYFLPGQSFLLSLNPSRSDQRLHIFLRHMAAMCLLKTWEIKICTTAIFVSWPLHCWWSPPYTSVHFHSCSTSLVLTLASSVLRQYRHFPHRSSQRNPRTWPASCWTLCLPQVWKISPLGVFCAFHWFLWHKGAFNNVHGSHLSIREQKRGGLATPNLDIPRPRRVEKAACKFSSSAW